MNAAQSRSGALACLSLTGATVAEDLAMLQRCRGRVDLAELRADLLAPTELAAAVRIPAQAGVPVILTIRRAQDGGRWTGGERERLRLLARLAAAGDFAWIDLEEDVQSTADDLGAPASTQVIRSIHDVSGVPADLAARLQRLARGPRELPKAAVMLKGSADLLALLRVAESTRALQKIITGTGEAGFATRVLAGRIGSWLCYASPADSPQAAPGQVDPDTLAELYRFASIGPTTELFGVIGNPIGHSLSPVIHNRGLAALALDAVYLPFLVDEVPAFLEAARLMDVRGLSVTVPHKEAVLGHLSSRDPIVDRLGACNTMVKRGEGWHGTNTDAEGFLRALGRELDRVRGRSATVIGAGGAARAIVDGLVSAGCDVLVLNRTVERAREVARRSGARWGGLDAATIAEASARSDLVVQATSAGMSGSAAGNGEADPAPGYRFRGHEVVFDVVYSPRTTPFMARAAGAGCTVISGIFMLVEQAKAQFRLFTGREYPIENSFTTALTHSAFPA